MSRILIKEGTIINRGERFESDVLIEHGKITKVDSSISLDADIILHAPGKWILPGIIDDQVHFRDPGLTHKASIYTESRAAVAGGVTSFMEMPNTNPPATTQEKLEDKYQIASRDSLANYSFYMGASNDNLEEVLKTDATNVCGVKIFMGSSTGNMLVDKEAALNALFSKCPLLIATHCESESVIRDNQKFFTDQFGDDIPIELHPEIRNVRACLASSAEAISLAKKYNTRLHILHISTAEETMLFRSDVPLEEKRITSEVCVHHLSFSADDYPELGTKIKCNPAIKSARHRDSLWKALHEGRLDIIATDHAPHTIEEKSNPYTNAPSGLPLIQHTLNIMLDHAAQGRITPEKVVELMCHAPAACFNVKDRGFLEEGKWADIVIVDPNKPTLVTNENLYYKCGWSPFEGRSFSNKIESTIVSGHLAYHEGVFDERRKGKRLQFDS